MTLYIGLMSGTSMDGIDAALVDLPSNTLICGITKKYSADVSKRLKSLMEDSHTTLAALCQLNTLVGREFAEAVKDLLLEAKVKTTEIKAIGSHGQTVCHDALNPIPYTLQLGCGHTIAVETGIAVVADFRTRDLVKGGQGAPFAPIYHQILFASADSNVAVVNIGGIANITFLSSAKPTKGWDIGPGNCLMDAWINLHQGKSYDAGGAWANQGTVIQPLLKQLLADSFFALKTPKSIGKEYFSLEWLNKCLTSDYQPVDVQATLLALTAYSIADTLLNIKEQCQSLYLCGGGVHNNLLHQTLAHLLPEITVNSSAEMGINPDYLEAMMFAWLGAQTINNQPVDLSSITGSKGPEILGAIYTLEY